MPPMNPSLFPPWLFPPADALDDSGTNPAIVALLFVLRCLLPVVIMLGVSYLLRRFGWISEPPPPPPNGNGNGQPAASSGKPRP